MEKNPNWREKLIDTHMRFCVSPFHDRDVWNELDIEKHPEREEYIKQHLGEPKTAHYHVMIRADQNTTFKTMKDLTDSLGLPIPFKVESPYGLYRYFTHQDNPEKSQYDQHDIRHYNGSEPFDYIMEPNKWRISKMKHELAIFFRSGGYETMFEFEMAVADHFSEPYYLYLVQVNTIYFREFLKDNLTYKWQNKHKKINT